ncbi:MAG: S-layer homology domain-containing protein [Dysosmobacter sp.]
MKWSRLLSLLMTLALTLSLAAPAVAYHPGSLIPQTRTYSTPFADTRGTWCDAAVQTCYETGLMDGKSATAFDPQGSLTYGQIVVIVARLHELMNGGDGKFDPPAEGEAWYQPASDYLLSLPILNETDEITDPEVLNSSCLSPSGPWRSSRTTPAVPARAMTLSSSCRPFCRRMLWSPSTPSLPCRI